MLSILFSLILLQSVPPKSTAALDALSDEFKPANYGRLLPFAGKVYEFNSAVPEFAECRIYKVLYGLMTADGECVAPPIYSSAVTKTLDNGECIIVLEKDCGNPRDPDTLYRILTVVSSDGSKALSFIDGSLVSFSGGRIVISSFDKSTSSCRVYLYDYSLHLINRYSGYESFFGFCDGYLCLADTKNSRDIIIGSKSTVVFENVELASPFKNGIAPARLNGLFGVIGTDGKWLVEPHFDSVETVGKNSEYIHLHKGNGGILVDRNGISSRYIDPLGTREYYLANGKPIFIRGGRVYTDDGTPVRCKNGVYASQYNPDSELFFGSDGGAGYIFDLDGNVTVGMSGASGADRYNYYDGYFRMYAENGESTVSVIYRADTNKEVYRFISHGKGSHTFLLKIAPNGIAVFSQKNEFTDDEVYRLVDLNTGRVLADNCLHAEISRVGDSCIFSLCYADKIIIRDENYRFLFSAANDISDKRKIPSV